MPLARIDAESSQSQLDQDTAQWKAAEASVRSAEQSLRNARMNVGYTELRSPIDGIIEHTAAHVGDDAGPGTQFSVLTTRCRDIDTLTVDVAIPMSQYLRYAGDRTSIYDNGRAAVGYPLCWPTARDTRSEESTTTRARMSRRPPGRSSWW